MIWLKRVFLALSILIVTAGVLFALTRQSNLFKVREIAIHVSSEADPEQMPFVADGATVAALSARMKGKLKSFENQKIWEIKIGAIRDALGRDPWVQNIRVSRSFPNRLEVEIIPRAAVFLVSDSRGRLLPVSASGDVVTPVSATVLPDVPVLKAEKVLSDVDLRNKAVAFARELPISGQMSLSNMSEIEWTPNKGFVASLLSSKATVILGEDKIEAKIARVEQILDYLTVHQMNSRVIDASFSKKVLVRLRKGP